MVRSGEADLRGNMSNISNMSSSMSSLHGDILGTYAVQNRCTLRRGPDLKSENLGIMEAGGHITVFESAVSAQGVQRIRCAEGWISLKKGLVTKITDQSQVSAPLEQGLRLARVHSDSTAPLRSLVATLEGCSHLIAVDGAESKTHPWVELTLCHSACPDFLTIDASDQKRSSVQHATAEPRYHAESFEWKRTHIFERFLHVRVWCKRSSSINIALGEVVIDLTEEFGGEWEKSHFIRGSWDLRDPSCQVSQEWKVRRLAGLAEELSASEEADKARHSLLGSVNMTVELRPYSRAQGGPNQTARSGPAGGPRERLGAAKSGFHALRRQTKSMRIKEVMDAGELYRALDESAWLEYLRASHLFDRGNTLCPTSR